MSLPIGYSAMKQPRITDFDPNAKPTPAPELGSPLDGFPPIQRPAPPTHPLPPSPAVEKAPLWQEPSVPLGRNVLPVRGVPPKRRPIKQRHPFDIYADQLDALRQRALEERRQGGVGSMSAMVRDAIDAFLANKSDR
jgi:hypothetical protein